MAVKSRCPGFPFIYLPHFCSFMILLNLFICITYITLDAKQPAINYMSTIWFGNGNGRQRNCILTHSVITNIVSIKRPVFNVSALTWFIRYIYKFTMHKLGHSVYKCKVLQLFLLCKYETCIVSQLQLTT